MNNGKYIFAQVTSFLSVNEFNRCISKSNLAYANENRDWRIFADFAYKLIEEARLICTGSIDFDLDIEGNVYAVDSTTIDLCLSIFWWAKFRSTKAAVKMHTQLDLKTEIQ